MKLYCECGKEIGKTIRFSFKNFESDVWLICEWCGRKWYLYSMAREDAK